MRSDGSHFNLLIVGLNWLGDSVMSMPALAVLRRRLPEAHLTMLVKPGLAPLWELNATVDEVLEQPATGLLRWAAGPLRARAFDRAYIFPNSFRAALIPFLARVPVRRGQRGHARRWMLTDTVSGVPDPHCQHQLHEYLEVVGLIGDRELWRLPLLRVAPEPLAAAQARLGAAAGHPWVGVFPGAARGPSKRWPAGRFAAVARRLQAEAGCRVLLLGGPADVPVCGEVARLAGSGVLNLAGSTSLPEMAALLSCCRAVVSNDSGGMHVAAGLGVPVVAIFGLTDPARTGPLGPGHQVLTAGGYARSRDVPRHSELAAQALAAIPEERVFAALQAVLAARGGGVTP